VTSLAKEKNVLVPTHTFGVFLWFGRCQCLLHYSRLWFSGDISGNLDSRTIFTGEFTLWQYYRINFVMVDSCMLHKSTMFLFPLHTNSTVQSVHLLGNCQ